MDYQNRANGWTNALNPVTLQTANGGAMGDWKILDLLDLNGGELTDGDPIALRTSKGLFVQADQGGGGPLLEAGFAPFVWETFTVIDLDRPGAVVQSGDAVALRSSSGRYVSAELGGGGAVTATRSSIGSWETFRLLSGK